MKNSLEEKKKEKLEEFKKQEVIYDPVSETPDEAIEDNKASWEKFKKERKTLGGAFTDLTKDGLAKFQTKEEKKKKEKALLAKMFEQYKEQEKELEEIENKKNSRKEKAEYFINKKKIDDLLDHASDVYKEFEKIEENSWYENEKWNKKLNEAKGVDAFLKNLNNYKFLNEKFTNQEGKREFVANKEYLEKDYTKSIFFLASYLTPEEIWELIRTEKGATREDHLEREFYTLSDKDLEGEFGNKIVKIKKRDENKNLVEEEISIRDLIALGQKRIKQAITAEDKTISYMKKNNIASLSRKIGKTIYQNFPKIKIGKKETVNQIPFDMAFVVARGYYGADSFATFDKENGKISLVSNPEIVNQIYTEIKEIIPDFPEPIGAKLLTPDDPEIIKQIREKMSEEKWREILGIVATDEEKSKVEKQELKIEEALEKEESKTAHINTDEGAEDEDSMKGYEYKKPSTENTEQEEKLKRIEEIKIREVELQTKIADIEKNLQKILEKIEEMEKKDKVEVKKYSAEEIQRLKEKIEEKRKKELNRPYHQIKSEEEKQREYARYSGNYPKIRELINKFIDIRTEIDSKGFNAGDELIIKYNEIKNKLEALDGAPDVDSINREIFSKNGAHHEEARRRLLHEFSEENRYENKVNAKYDQEIKELESNNN